MNLLKGALMKKHSELKIEVSKTFSDIIITNNPSSNTLVTNNSVSSTNWSIQTSANTSSSSSITVNVKSLVLFFLFFGKRSSNTICIPGTSLDSLIDTVDFVVIFARSNYIFNVFSNAF
jgi:hypothetical protein